MSWETPSVRVRELIRKGAQIVLDPPVAWLAELDEATLAGAHRAVIAQDPVLAAGRARPGKRGRAAGGRRPRPRAPRPERVGPRRVPGRPGRRAAAVDPDLF